MADVKVSIIVPVYNVEKYLRQCMDSIINQTLNEIEIICLDDCSTDFSGKILDEYAKKDSRVIVIHKEKNGGYGHSLNMGMRLAQGEYIGIVESDDVVLPRFYEVMYEKAKKFDLDFVKSDVTFWWEDIGYTFLSRFPWLEEYYNKVLTKGEIDIRLQFRMNIWSGIYKRSFIEKHGICLNEAPNHVFQDNGFWIQSMLYADRAMWIDDSFYLYRQDNPNQSVRQKKRITDMSQEYEWTEKLLIARNATRKEIDICNRQRLQAGYYEFYRAADEYKKEISEIILKDYKLYKDTIKDNAELVDWYEKFIYNPESFCDTIIDKKSKLNMILNDATKIVIYGAGIRGQWLFRNLCYQGRYDQIVGFAISGDASGDNVAGIPIKNIRDYQEAKDDVLVIVSTKEDSVGYSEMIKTLSDLEFEHYMPATEIFENYYSLS